MWPTKCAHSEHWQRCWPNCVLAYLVCGHGLTGGSSRSSRARRRAASAAADGLPRAAAAAAAAAPLRLPHVEVEQGDDAAPEQAELCVGQPQHAAARRCAVPEALSRGQPSSSDGRRVRERRRGGGARQVRSESQRRRNWAVRLLPAPHPSWPLHCRRPRRRHGARYPRRGPSCTGQVAPNPDPRCSASISPARGSKGQLTIEWAKRSEKA